MALISCLELSVPVSRSRAATVCQVVTAEDLNPSSTATFNNLKNNDVYNSTTPKLPKP